RKLFESFPAPTTEGTPSMIMAPISIVLGRGTYFPSMVRAAGFKRSRGIRLPGNGSRKVAGLAAPAGREGSKFGLDRELNGLKMFTPPSRKSPTASSSVGTVATDVLAFTLRSAS